MTDRRILVDFPASDYVVHGRVVSGPRSEWRTYRIRNGEPMVKFDRMWWRVYESEYTFSDGTTYRCLSATSV